MANITTRQAQLTPLTHAQVDLNFLNLNAELADVGADAAQALDNFTTMQLALRTFQRQNGVNYIEVGSGAAFNSPTVVARGPGTDVGMYLATTGNGPFQFATGGGSFEQFAIGHTQNAVNRVLVRGGASGANPLFEAIGNGSDLGFDFNGKGSGSHFFRNGNGMMAQMYAPPGAVNFFNLTSNSANNQPLFTVVGTDPDISMRYRTKGIGAHLFESGTFGNIQFEIGNRAGADARIAAVGGATGVSNCTFAVIGTATSMGIDFNAKGAGVSYFNSNGGTQLAVGNTANAMNFVMAYGGASTIAPSLHATGPGADIDLMLVSKGTGRLCFGTFSANGDAAVNGYITIKDSAGNVRKLATIA